MTLLKQMTEMKRLAESFVKGCEKVIGSLKQADEEKEGERNLFSDLEDLVEVREPVKRTRVRTHHRNTPVRPYRPKVGMVRIDNLGRHYGRNTRDMREVCARLGVQTEKENSYLYIWKEDAGYIIEYLERNFINLNENGK